MSEQVKITAYFYPPADKKTGKSEPKLFAVDVDLAIYQQAILLGQSIPINTPEGYYTTPEQAGVTKPTYEASTTAFPSFEPISVAEA